MQGQERQRESTRPGDGLGSRAAAAGAVAARGWRSAAFRVRHGMAGPRPISCRQRAELSGRSQLRPAARRPGFRVTMWRRSLTAAAAAAAHRRALPAGAGAGAVTPGTQRARGALPLRRRSPRPRWGACFGPGRRGRAAVTALRRRPVVPDSLRLAGRPDGGVGDELTRTPSRANDIATRLPPGQSQARLRLPLAAANITVTQQATGMPPPGPPNLILQVRRCRRAFESSSCLV